MIKICYSKMVTINCILDQYNWYEQNDISFETNKITHNQKNVK